MLQRGEERSLHRMKRRSGRRLGSGKRNDGNIEKDDEEQKHPFHP